MEPRTFYMQYWPEAQVAVLQLIISFSSLFLSLFLRYCLVNLNLNYPCFHYDQSQEEETERHRTRVKKYFLTKNEKLTIVPKKFKKSFLIRSCKALSFGSYFLPCCRTGFSIGLWEHYAVPGCLSLGCVRLCPTGCFHSEVHPYWGQHCFGFLQQAIAIPVWISQRFTIRYAREEAAQILPSYLKCKRKVPGYCYSWHCSLGCLHHILRRNFIGMTVTERLTSWWLALLLRSSKMGSNTYIKVMVESGFPISCLN